MKKRNLFVLAALSLSAAAFAGCNEDLPLPPIPQQCDSSAKPSDDCTCVDGEWKCKEDKTCDEAKKPEGDCSCVDGNWKCKEDKTCDEAKKPEGNCSCVDGSWNCKEDKACDEAKKPEGDCSCVDGSWNCKEDKACDEAKKPEGDCTCDGGEWSCTVVNQCNEEDKPEGDCTCSDGDWDCKEAKCEEAQKPEGECACAAGEWKCETEPECSDDNKPSGICTCDSGEWKCQDAKECDESTKPDEDCVCSATGEWVCEEVSDCPTECPDNCTDGVCNTTQCPSECPGTCDESGKCPVVEKCPEQCPDDCTDGVCNSSTPSCDPACTNGCDDDGNCKTVCSEKCQNGCNADGSCTCPSTCKSGCNADGTCKCPSSCKNGCKDDGSCACPDACKTGCGTDGACTCPSTCKNGCNADGTCKCPSTCAAGCDTNTGTCKCPTSCTTSCDASGKCKCPSTCSSTCDANGVCPVMCGSEKVTKIYFGAAEVDIIAPESITGLTTRHSSYSTLYIKTEKNTYTMETAPKGCAENITISSSDKAIMTVKKDGAKATFTAVAAGTATCTAKIKNTDKSAEVKVHVLNPKKLTGNMAVINADGKFSHLYRGPLKLVSGTRVSQGFDFYNTSYLYFTQLPKATDASGKNTYGTIKGSKATFDRTAAGIFKHTPSTTNDKPMYLYGSGHAQNLIIETTGGKDYVWVANYGSLVKGDDGNYTDGYKTGQTISRIEYQSGKSFTPSQVSEHYYLSDKTGGSYYYNFEPAHDIKNGKFGIRATYNKDSKTYVKLFSMSKAKALGTSSVKLPMGITTLNTDLSLKPGWKPTITVKDLAGIDATHSVAISMDSGIPIQGIDVENGIIYVVGGIPKDLSANKYESVIVLKLYTYGGTLIKSYDLKTANSKKCTTAKISGHTCLATADFDKLFKVKEDNVQYTNIGYLEPEGIRVSDGKVYISVTGKQGYTKSDGSKATRSRQYIFSYNLAH